MTADVPPPLTTHTQIAEGWFKVAKQLRHGQRATPAGVEGRGSYQHTADVDAGAPDTGEFKVDTGQAAGGSGGGSGGGGGSTVAREALPLLPQTVAVAAEEGEEAVVVVAVGIMAAVGDSGEPTAVGIMAAAKAGEEETLMAAWDVEEGMSLPPRTAKHECCRHPALPSVFF
ncbi:hypothetical protein T492DRAFT_832708 [Pavlovales sp. CCMP2436]|nr:hypothetical protein T492DRAFT_832708 [Pavlovales sp. CCMP2436]